jgi:hypothetical protein
VSSTGECLARNVRRSNASSPAFHGPASLLCTYIYVKCSCAAVHQASSLVAPTLTQFSLCVPHPSIVQLLQEPQPSRVCLARYVWWACSLWSSKVAARSSSSIWVSSPCHHRIPPLLTSAGSCCSWCPFQGLPVNNTFVLSTLGELPGFQAVLLSGARC